MLYFCVEFDVWSFFRCTCCLTHFSVNHPVSRFISNFFLSVEAPRRCQLFRRDALGKCWIHCWLQNKIQPDDWTTYTPKQITWIPKMVVWKRWLLTIKAVLAIYLKFLGMFNNLFSLIQCFFVFFGAGWNLESKRESSCDSQCNCWKNIYVYSSGRQHSHGKSPSLANTIKMVGSSMATAMLVYRSLVLPKKIQVAISGCSIGGESPWQVRHESSGLFSLPQQ